MILLNGKTIVWYPWFLYCKGKILVLDTNPENTYEYMNDDKDRAGCRWACDYCVEKILYDNNIITVTDEKGKFIDYNTNHPILDK